MILALDPGTSQTGFVLAQGFPLPEIVESGKLPNSAVLSLFDRKQLYLEHVILERFASYGMAIGQSTIDAIEWGGYFRRCAEALGLPVRYVYRREVKLFLCNSPRANDSSIRQAIIDLYGGKEVAIGKKANQGPLYGVKSDAWSALALALYHLRQQDFQA